MVDLIKEMSEGRALNRLHLSRDGKSVLALGLDGRTAVSWSLGGGFTTVEDATARAALDPQDGDSVLESESGLVYTWSATLAAWILTGGAGVTAFPAARYDLDELPTTGTTFEIAGDVYEYLDDGEDTADPANIGVLIGVSVATTLDAAVAAVNATIDNNQHPDLFNGDGVTPARANGTENFLAIDMTTHFLLVKANRPGGTPQDDTVSAALEPIISGGTGWDVANMSALYGALANTPSRRATLSFTVDAALIALTTAKRQLIDFVPTAVVAVSHRTANGVVRGRSFLKVLTGTQAGVGGYVDLLLTPENLAALTAGEYEVDTVNLVVKDTDITHGSWKPARGARVLGFRFIRPEALAGGATLTLDVRSVIADGTATNWASAVNVAAGSDEATQTFTPDDVVPPQNMPVGSRLEFRVNGAASTTAPVSMHVEVLWVEVAVATDIITIEVVG